MIRADYLVITFDKSLEIEAAYPIIAGYWMPDPQPFALYGFRGHKCGKFFIGEKGDRMLIQATGGTANEVALRLPLPPSTDYSVARIDVQVTFAVRDADFLIRSCEPSPVYKACRWIPVKERGETLYVGAPASDARLRLYNKTAEAGVRPEGGGEFLRVELQFRNKKADRMFLAFRARNPRLPFITQVKRMVDAFTYQMINNVLNEQDQEIFPEEPDFELDWVSRRKAWLERSVVPALRKVLAAEPEYLKIFLELLDTEKEVTYNDF